MLKRSLFALSAAALAGVACAQDNYEIQVYGSDTVKKGTTMVELHSNYTFNGRTGVVNGVLPTNHALHETVEITHGFTNTFETGFYIFTSYRDDEGYNYVGSHIRPRWRVPDSWKWPVGTSLSLEYGWQKRNFAEDDSDLEIRPIVDKQLGRWYLALNPALERSLHGLNSSAGFVFSPNVKVSYDITKVVTFGFEYYGSVGPITDWDTVQNQTNQIFPAVDLNVGADWEINFGIGFGMNRSSNESQGTIVKLILGRHFSF